MHILFEQSFDLFWILYVLMAFRGCCLLRLWFIVFHITVYLLLIVMELICFSWHMNWPPCAGCHRRCKQYRWQHVQTRRLTPALPRKNMIRLPGLTRIGASCWAQFVSISWRMALGGFWSFNEQGFFKQDCTTVAGKGRALFITLLYPARDTAVFGYFTFICR